MHVNTRPWVVTHTLVRAVPPPPQSYICVAADINIQLVKKGDVCRNHLSNITSLCFVNGNAGKILSSSRKCRFISEIQNCLEYLSKNVTTEKNYKNSLTFNGDHVHHPKSPQDTLKTTGRNRIHKLLDNEGKKKKKVGDEHLIINSRHYINLIRAGWALPDVCTAIITFFHRTPSTPFPAHKGRLR